MLYNSLMIMFQINFFLPNKYSVKYSVFIRLYIFNYI